MPQLFEPIFAALNNAGVRYMVVGGLATVLHGYARLTADVDLIVDLTPPEARKAIAALTHRGSAAGSRGHRSTRGDRSPQGTES